MARRSVADLLRSDKPKRQPTVTQGSVVRLLAVSKTELLFLIVTEEAVTGTRKRRRSRYRRNKEGRVATAACIVALNRELASKAGRAAEAHLAWAVATDSAAGRIDSGLVARINEQLYANLAGQFRVSRVNEDQLERLLGTSGIRTSRTAMLSEDTTSKRLNEIAEGIVAAAGATAGARAVGTAVATRVAAIAAAEAAAQGSAVLVTGVVSAELGASLAMAGVVGAGVVVAAAGGYAAGTQVNEGLTALFGGGRTLGDVLFDAVEDTSFGQWVSGVLRGEPAFASDEPSSDAANPGSSEEEPAAEDNSTDENPEEDDDPDEADEDNADEDDPDDDNPEDDEPEEEDSAGTTVDPELQAGSPVGTLLLYLATGLCRNEMKQQQRAIDIAAGGDLGVNREKAIDLHWDQMIGGLYLKSVLRGLEARRNAYGQRDPVSTYVALPDKRFFINGAICPPAFNDRRVEIHVTFP